MDQALKKQLGKRWTNIGKLSAIAGCIKIEKMPYIKEWYSRGKFVGWIVTIGKDLVASDIDVVI